MAINDTGLVSATSSPPYTIYIVICLAILLVLGALIIWRRSKKNKVPKEIPEDVLKEFDRAEALTLQYKGLKTPQQILWQINEERKHLFTLEKGEYDIATPEQIAIQPQPIPTQTKPKINLGNLFKRRIK